MTVYDDDHMTVYDDDHMTVYDDDHMIDLYRPVDVIRPESRGR